MRAKAEQKTAMIGQKEIREKIMQDIDALQLAPSEKLFDEATKLFLKKWRKEDVANLHEYLLYFENEWIKVIFFI